MFSRRIAQLLLAVAFISLMASLPAIAGAFPRAHDLDPAQAIELALDSARASGSYRLMADMHQVLTPRASVSSIGEGETAFTLRLEGEAQVPDRVRLEMALPGLGSDDNALGVWGAGATGVPRTVSILVLEDEAFVGHRGTWRQVENPLGAAAPTADYLSLLSAARDVERVGEYLPGDESATTDSGSDAEDGEGAGTDSGNDADGEKAAAIGVSAGGAKWSGHYRFALDGPAYAEQVRERMSKLLAHELPVGAQLQAPETYELMTGTGELWVDQSGHPRRLHVTMTLPAISDGRDAHVDIRCDFFDFGAVLDPIVAPVVEGGEPISESSQPEASDASASADGGESLAGRAMDMLRRLALPAIGAFLAVALVSERRRRLVYVAVATTVATSMLVTPLVQAASMSRFAARAGQTESLPEALAELGLAPSPDEPDHLADLARDLGDDLMSSSRGLDCTVLPPGIPPDGDEDGDGLDNVTERCLGTDYLNPDTDGDTITDTLELRGFSTGSGAERRTWTTSPIQRDSNRDGMDDASEWNPEWVEEKPSTLDHDGDGVANAWDNDNDGDGVPDAPDISPYEVLEFRSSYSISVSKPVNDPQHEDTYVNIDLQVQPRRSDHLRYTTTFLDWPHDDKAQIQELDDSNDDVKLIPTLEFKTQTKPSLAQQYGLRIRETDDGHSHYYKILVPLVPLEDSGTVVAFRTRLGFTPHEAEDLSLYDIKLGWLAQAKQDAKTCKGSGTGCTEDGVRTDVGPIVSYYDDAFRVTGLSVTESKDVQVLLLGVPSAPEITDGSEPDELREMANLVSGLSPALLYHQHPDLDEVKQRFTDDGTPEEQRWGVTTPVETHLQSYAHHDLAMASTVMTATRQFLDANYGVSRTATLAVAYEEDTGAVVAVDGAAGYSGGSSGALRFDLSYNPLLTVRQVQLHEYRYDLGVGGDPSWSALTMNEAHAELDRRYTDADQTEFAHYVWLIFTAWYGGQVNYVAVDGQPLVGEKADDKAIFDHLHYPTQNRLPEFVVRAYHLDSLAERIDLDGAGAGWREWAAEEFAQSGVSEGFGPFAGMVGSIAVALGPVAYQIGRAALLAIRTAAGSAPAASEAAEIASGAESVAETSATVARTIARIAIVLAIVVAVVAIVMIWISFSGYSSNVSHLQTDMELANDIAATVVVVLSLAMSLFITLVSVAVAETGIGLIIELVFVLVLYFTVAMMSGDWNPLHTFNWVAEWLSGVFHDYALYTEIPYENAVQSGGLSLKLEEGSPGTIVGKPVTIKSRMTTTVEVASGRDWILYEGSRQGKVSDLDGSWAFSTWRTEDQHSQTTWNEYKSECRVSGEKKRCPSDSAVTITPDEAKRNFATEIVNIMHYRLAYQSCWGFVIYFCGRDHAEDTQPKATDSDSWDQAKIPLYVDVLPSDLEALWGWSELTNTDPDGDGLETAHELSIGTDPYKWDTDGDLLTDGYEHEYATESGANPLNPLKADTDSDGLLDLDELRLGTGVLNLDTDDDGLTDGEEVCRADADGNLVGGWRASQAGGHWVCSSPHDPDADRDNLLDSMEKTLGQSPHAPNTAPRADLAAGPQIVHDGARLVLRKPGDRVTVGFDAYNDTAAAISRTMRLCAAADTFGDAEQTSMVRSPDYGLPALATEHRGSQTCASWDLAAHPMFTGDRITATLATTVTDGAASHATTPLELSLPYKDPTDGSSQTIERSVGIMVDAEPPSTTIVTPTKEIPIDGTAYVVGGVALDATSWITKVEVAVDGDVGWQTATGLETWAWTWSPLPADEEYTIRARSYDAVGHVSADDTGKVIVDNTPPGARFKNVTDGEVLTDLQPDSIGGATLRLEVEGDDTVSGASKVAGVARVQLSIDGRPWETLWSQIAGTRGPNTKTARFDWRIDADATGSHTLAARAVDKLGHVGEPTIIEVIVDLVPPAGMVSDNAGMIPVGETFVLHGHEDETGFLPLVPRPEPLEGTIGAVEGATAWLDPTSPAGAQSVAAVWLGDVNGDGRADLAVGMPDDDDGAGRVAIVHGRAGGWPIPPDSVTLASPDASLVMNGSVGLGAHIAAAGDVNSDGLSDILVGDSHGGAAYIVFGRAGSLGLDMELTAVRTNPGLGVELKTSKGTIGAFVAAAGDVNGDGYGDVLIGAADETGQAGATYLVPGDRHFARPSTDVAAAAAAVVPADDHGAAATGVGDVNGDQLADFVVADPRASLGDEAAVYLFLGDVSYEPVSRHYPQQALDPAADSAAAFPADGSSTQVAALGDLDADGYSDFAYVTARGAQVVFGRQGPGSGTQPSFRTGTLGDATTRFVAGAGDIDADGHDDLVLGAAGDTAQVVHGAQPFPTAPTASSTITGTKQVAPAPYAAGADCNCDGSSDLLVIPAAPAPSAAYLDFGDEPHIDPATLPVSGAPAGPRAGSQPSSTGLSVLPRLGLPSWLQGGVSELHQESGSTVHVAPAFCPACENGGRLWGAEAFSSIQAAIDSGARRIVVHPGVYRGLIVLADGVEIIGSGAEATILRPPVEHGAVGDALVTADGVTDTRLARLTVDGTGLADGVLATGGASVSLERLAIRNAAAAATAEGAGTSLTSVGLTVVANDEGLLATDCAVIDVRNTIFAYNAGPAMTYRMSGCPGTSLNRYNGFWRNNGAKLDLVVDGAEVDVSTAGQGMVPADPRFVDPTHHDYHLQRGSPAIDAGDVSDSAPPGTGLRVDLGCFQNGQASFYADGSYTDFGENDGLEWGVNAFAVVGEAMDAMQAALPAYDCRESAVGSDGCGVQLSVGIGPGTYDVQRELPSNLRLQGTGPDVSKLRGPGTGSVLSLTNATHTEVSGFEISGFGTARDDAAVKVLGATTGVTVTRNVIRGGDGGSTGTSSGVMFADNASGVVLNNTIVGSGAGVSGIGQGAHVRAANNIFVDNEYGVYVENGTPTNLQLYEDYNLFHGNTRDVAGSSPNVVSGGHSVSGRDPQFVDAVSGDYRLRPDSPAINVGDPYFGRLIGTGAFVDIGSHEVRATPLALLFGQEGLTCATGNSGVEEVELGLSYVADPRQPISATIPTSWATAALSETGGTGTHWSVDLRVDDGMGIYRLYERGTDVAGNDDTSYLTQYAGDDQAPVVAWTTPGDGETQEAAAVELVASASDYVTTPLGTTYAVDAVWFEVDGEPVEAHWSTRPWDELEAEPREFRAVVPRGVGTHTVVAASRDQAGHVTRAPQRTVTLTGIDAATVYAPESGTATSSSVLEVRGYARLGGGPKVVKLFVDGAEVGDAQLADPNAAETTWMGEVSLAGEMTHTLQAVAGNGSLLDAAPVHVRLDTTDPTVDVAGPHQDEENVFAVPLTGTADDLALARVEVSVDGGYQWRTAVLTATKGQPTDWGHLWIAPAGSDHVRYPIRVRAVDRAGNTALDSQYVTVDNVAPDDPAAVVIKACTTVCTTLAPGDSFKVPEQLEVGWRYPVADGSGPAAVRLAATTDAEPPASGAPEWKAPTTNSTYKALVVSSGTYYVHIAATDKAGNETVGTRGPYYAGIDPPSSMLALAQGSGAPRSGSSAVSPEIPGTLQADWALPIHVDGRVNVPGREWHPETQVLGVDSGAQGHQELLAAWDAADLFLAWTGALWAQDGSAWIYLDTRPGGTRDPASGSGGAGAGPAGPAQLPFEADFAVYVSSSAEGGVQRYEETERAWRETSVDGFEFANSTRDETEVRLPLAAIGAAGPVKLLAIGVDSDGGVWSVFPTSNPIGGDWDDAYEWAALSPDVVPNEGQPEGHHVRVSVRGETQWQRAHGPDDELEYVVTVENTDPAPVSDMRLDLMASDGATLTGLAGVAGPAPAPAATWTVDPGTLATGFREPITVTARLAANLGATSHVTVSATLVHEQPAGEPAEAASGHMSRVDSEAPSVRVWQPATDQPHSPGRSGVASMRPGAGVVRGTAVDHGAGVARVEVRVDEGEWQTAQGTHAWQADVEVPVSGAFELEVRAVDHHGHHSIPATIAVTVDDEAPIVELAAPGEVLAGVTAVLQGTVAEHHPEHGEVATVELQIDDGPWHSVHRHGQSTDGDVTWHYRWRLPKEEGIRHQLRVRATDVAGNVGEPSPAVTVTVDSRPPHTTIEHPNAGARVTGAKLLVWGNATDGWGVDRVEASADGGRTWHEALLGADAARLVGVDWPDTGPIAPAGSNAIYLPRVSSGEPLVPDTLWAVELSVPTGEVVLRSRGVDRAGNSEPLKAPVRIQSVNPVP